MSTSTLPASARPLAPELPREPRGAPLHMEAEEFRRHGHALVDLAAAFLASMRERPVTADEPPAELQGLIDATRPLPEEGADTKAILDDAANLLFSHSLFNGHPRFFGYITGAPAPIGMLGDFLASVVNANVGAWRLAPMATEIEGQTVRWIAELIGYPASGGGLLVSGGNMANMVALFAARAAAADWDIRAAGVAAAGARRLRVYASPETHTWLQKGTDLSGLGTDAVHWIPTDDSLRMDPAALRAAIAADRAAGDRPMMVVASAGTVSTGVVDPLVEIAAVCHEEGIWFHVDGAYGALAACTPDVPADLHALALADSVAVDPHKWMYAPLEAGCTLVRDPALLRGAFAYHPPYYHFGQEATNYFDWGPQNSRGFRALKLWLALRQVGRSGYVRMIGDDIALSRRFHAAVERHPALEAVSQALSINTFRYVPADLRAEVGTPAVETFLNVLNEALLERIQSSGEAFVSNAVVGGRYLLRACIVNFNTTAADVEAIPEIVARLGGEVDATMRSPASH